MIASQLLQTDDFVIDRGNGTQTYAIALLSLYPSFYFHSSSNPRSDTDPRFQANMFAVALSILGTTSLRLPSGLA